MLTNKYSTSAFHPVCVCGEQLHYESLLKHRMMTSRTSKQQRVGRARVCCHILQFSLSHSMTKIFMHSWMQILLFDLMRSSNQKEAMYVGVCVCVSKKKPTPDNP